MNVQDVVQPSPDEAVDELERDTVLMEALGPLLARLYSASNAMSPISSKRKAKMRRRANISISTNMEKTISANSAVVIQ